MSHDPESPAIEQQPAPFTSSHTGNFPALLRDLGISLLVSTYQAGRVIVVRAEGEQLNTHFRDFPCPMGMAYQPSTGRLAIGTRSEVCEFRNQPEVAYKIEPPGSHDAAFLPRRQHTSGDIRIHEIGWIGDEVWAVNTRFSCLCTFDAEHSFVPRWQPPFISALVPEDRCHLNGMAIIGDRVRYVTCLGRTDTAGGWRVDKAGGGCLLDVETGDTRIAGLCMPHSPRQHEGQLWLLESGIGSLSTADIATGRATAITRLPGFTRGMDFHGHLAFIGLSQVRESATFSGIPLVEELKERVCGVWVVDLRNGRTVAFLRFEGTVQEIFAVQVLPDIRHPDILHEPSPLRDSAFILPDDALAQVPERLRAGTRI